MAFLKGLLLILGALALWGGLYYLTLRAGLWLIDRNKKLSIKRWGKDVDDSACERKKFILWLTIFFVGVTILLWIGFIQFLLE